MSLTTEEFHTVGKAYKLLKGVLKAVKDDPAVPLSTIFELSAAIGVVETLLNKEHNDQIRHAHQPIQRIKVLAKRGLWKGYSRDDRQDRVPKRRPIRAT